MANGFQFGDTVQYEVAVTDDQPVDCSKVQVTYILGHDTHGHPLTRRSGAPAVITTVPAGTIPATDDLSAVFAAEYTDAGSGNLPPLTGTDQVVIEPTRLAQCSTGALPPGRRPRRASPAGAGSTR